LLVAAATAATTGCGGRNVDPARAETFARGAIQPVPRAVHCPKGVKVEKGKAFDCDVTAADGTRAKITLHVTDDAGHVRVEPGDLKRP
jgi:hypothetical protein